ncbi:MAG TPA: hypothetical protein G4N95_02615 [Anaerolineae bacterium]|nr:hypothetical protein [Anaerolineae bacterium]
MTPGHKKILFSIVGISAIFLLYLGINTQRYSFAKILSRIEPLSFINENFGGQNGVAGTFLQQPISKKRLIENVNQLKLSPSLTPFQPKPFTQTPSPTSTATITMTPLPTRTSTQTATPPYPSRALITGIYGRFPIYSLDCEARSAVDWASFFGVVIAEASFQAALPISDNPNRGFVGNVHGVWGLIPPYSYGVYAKPVAKLLREYGINAEPIYGMSWKKLKSEIAHGKPVMVWVIGRVGNGMPLSYTSSDGDETVVAHYEHTVIVIGYSQSSVTVLDGEWKYDRPIEKFLESWAVLGNMAIVLGD